MNGEVLTEEGDSIARLDVLAGGVITLGLGVGAYQHTVLGEREAAELRDLLAQALAHIARSRP